MKNYLYPNYSEILSKKSNLTILNKDRGITTDNKRCCNPNFIKTCLLLLVTSVLLFNTACKDENVIPGDLNELKSIQHPSIQWENYNWTPVFTGVDPANLNNPFDEVGIGHNTALDYYYAHYNRNWDTISDEENYLDSVISIYKNYCYLFEDNSELIYDYFDELKTNLFTFENMEEVVLNYSLDSTVFNWKIAIQNHILHKDNIKSMSVDSTINYLKQMEDSIVFLYENNLLAFEQYKQVLQYTAIFKYSHIYWYECLTGQNTIYTDCYPDKNYFDPNDPSTEVQNAVNERDKVYNSADASWVKTHPLDKGKLLEAGTAVWSSVAVEAYDLKQAVKGLWKLFS